MGVHPPSEVRRVGEGRRKGSWRVGRRSRVSRGDGPELGAYPPPNPGPYPPKASPEHAGRRPRVRLRAGPAGGTGKRGASGNDGVTVRSLLRDIGSGEESGIY